MLDILASIALMLFVFALGIASAIRIGFWMSAVFADFTDEKPDMTDTAEMLMMQ